MQIREIKDGGHMGATGDTAMTARPMTTYEALGLFFNAFAVFPDVIATGIVSAGIAPMAQLEALTLAEAYMTTLPGKVDRWSIRILPDTIEGSDLPAVQIIVTTGDAL